MSALGAVRTAPLVASARSVAPTSLAREEFFVLELDASADSSPGRARTRRQVGVSVWRRSEGDQLQLECESRFFEERTRVQQVERPGDDAARFVWREWRANQGRTLRVQWNEATERCDLVEWGRDEPTRIAIDAANGLLWPLQAVEIARESNDVPSPFVWFDPLARACETVHATVEWRGQPSPRDANEQELVRRVRLSTVDGVCVGEFEFVADELRAYRWQASGLRARRVDSDEYARCVSEHEASLAVR